MTQQCRGTRPMVQRDAFGDNSPLSNLFTIFVFQPMLKMSTESYVVRCLTVAVFVLAVCTPILRQVVDYASSTQIQLVEEIPEEEKEQDNKDNEQNLKDKKFCSECIVTTVHKLEFYPCQSSKVVQNADYSSMPDPPPELV